MRLIILAPAAMLCLLQFGCGASATRPNRTDPHPAKNASDDEGAVSAAAPPPTGAYPGAQPGATAGSAIPTSAPHMLEPVLQGQAATQAPGMQPDGQVFAAQFQEGQTWEQPVNILSGKCYTVVAVGIGIQELDIQLVMTLPPMPPAVLAADATTGATAIIGGRASGCWKNPSPVSGPARLILRATRGAGVAAAQMYMK